MLFFDAARGRGIALTLFIPPDIFHFFSRSPYLFWFKFRLSEQ